MRFLLGFFFIVVTCYSKTAIADFTATGKATFLAIGKPSFLKINGTGAKLSCLLKGESVISGECKANLTKLDTDLDLRNRHMHDKYLDTAVYPEAVLKLDPFEVKEGDSKFKGLLQIKKETSEVEGACKVAKVESLYKVSCQFEVNIKSYPSIGVPSYLGVTVADKVEVKIELEAK